MTSKVSAESGGKQSDRMRFSRVQNWSCSACTLINVPLDLFCSACGTKRKEIPEITVLKVVVKPQEESGEKLARRNLDSTSDKIFKQNNSVAAGRVPKSSSNQPLQEVVKNQDNDFWECHICTLRNELKSPRCTACSFERHLKESHKLKENKHPVPVSRRKSNDPQAPNFGVNETFEAIISTCSSLNVNFVDASFPPGPMSLYHNKKSATVDDEDRIKGFFEIPWLRPGQIYNSHSDGSHLLKWSVMKNPQPSDVCQGHLGDCWIVGSLALISERKELLENIIQTKTVNSCGVYVVRLNYYGKWTDVILDDTFPCDQYRRMLYAKGQYKQLWVPLVEKAMAKLHGSYEALIGGHLHEALTSLTGFPCETINLEDYVDKDLLWATLASSSDSGFLIGAGSHCKDVEKILENNRMNIKPRHAYSILQVVDWGQNGPKLIKLRNPWGKDSWKGDWSPYSSLWTNEMKKVLKPNLSEGGIFWMCFQDFLKHFMVVDICRIRQNWEYHTFQGIFVPYADSQTHPCYRIITEQCTELDLTLYQTEKSRMDFKKAESSYEVALLLLKTTPNSSKLTLVKYAKRDKRDANINLIVDTGEYYLLPVSFGHWTNDENSETYPEFQLLMYTSKRIKCNQFSPQKYLLADAMIEVGLKCCDKMEMKENNAILYHNGDAQLFGRGSLFMIENRYSDRWISFEVDLRKSEDINCTRGLKTIDCVPPKSRQIVNISTAKRRNQSYKLYWCASAKNVTKPSRRCMQHNPELTPRDHDLHCNRPLN